MEVTPADTDPNRWRGFTDEHFIRKPLRGSGLTQTDMHKFLLVVQSNEGEAPCYKPERVIY